MKRPYAFAQMYELKAFDHWQAHPAPVRQKNIIPSYEHGAILPLHPEQELDAMAQEAREYCLASTFYAFALFRAARDEGFHGAYHDVIQIRPIEIVRWMD